MPSRDGKSATTFWFDDDIKSDAKETAQKLGLTMTDLINKAVEYYVNNLPKIDPELGMKEALLEMKDAPKINQLENKIEKLNIQTSGVASQVDALSDKFNEIQEMIKNEVGKKVQPIVEALAPIIARLDQETKT